MPSKRERGKQRKAAKKLAPRNDSSIILSLVRKGDSSTTLSLAEPATNPPQAYRVSGAGTEFVNGLYEFDKEFIGSEFQYHYVVPDNASSGVGKKLTLFHCKTLDNSKWWYLSEADPNEPGTTKDIDYYSCKIKPGLILPSLSGWAKLNEGAGINPPPKLEAVGKVAVKGIKHADLPNGVLSVALNFLQRCEDETFAEVMLDVGGGDLISPESWIRILWRAATESSSCRTQIVSNIGTLVKCMCDDTKRQLFKSNKHWREGVLPFVQLISEMIYNSYQSDDSVDKTIITLLLQNKELLTSIVQWGFWRDDYRPDITSELSAEDCEVIVSLGKNTTIFLLMEAVDMNELKDNSEYECWDDLVLSDENLSLVQSIGIIPIISKSYDPTCMISNMVGMIHRLKNDSKSGLKLPLRTFRLLIMKADCVDEGVIGEMIDMGIWHSFDFDTAEFVAEMSSYMITRKGSVEKRRLPIDVRIAFAIRAGLIEMCLCFVQQFGSDESFLNDTFMSIFDYIKRIFKSVHEVSLHKKSAKAIRHKREDIEKELKCLEKEEVVTTNPNCKELLDMARSILNLNGSYCCRCNKSLSRTKVKLCNGCGCMAYCSKACQKEDWLNGHKLTCCKSYTDETAGQFQGRVLPETLPVCPRIAAKFKELEINMNMIQLKLLLDNSETILSQAKALDLHLSDCVVSLDLRYCPPTIGVKKYTHWFDTPEEKRGFDETRSKENITCISFSHRESDEDDGTIPVFQIQKLYPSEWLMKQSKSVISTCVVSLSPSKSSVASPAAVDSLSEHKRLHNIQMNKARWFPRSSGGYF